MNRNSGRFREAKALQFCEAKHRLSRPTGCLLFYIIGLCDLNSQFAKANCYFSLIKLWRWLKLGRIIEFRISKHRGLIDFAKQTKLPSPERWEELFFRYQVWRASRNGAEPPMKAASEEHWAVRAVIWRRGARAPRRLYHLFLRHRPRRERRTYQRCYRLHNLRAF